ncbi:MAG: EF-P beta-lysylation protein EpmB [Rhodanobacteraceae bacterium]
MITATPRSPQPAGPDWRQLWRDAITDATEMLELLDLEHLIHRLPANDAGFSMRVPRGFVARMRKGDPGDPLLLQVLPQLAELEEHPGYATDAVGDLDSRAAHGVLHKYQGRALLIASGTCAINCRYCFRRHFPYGEEIAAARQWHDALDYAREHPEIHELILSGGDPLALSTAKLHELSDGMSGMAHIRRLRIHTRLPVVLPERVDPEFCEWLAALPQQKIVMLHANHANELSANVGSACQLLRQCGATVLNQSVLLHHVNDNADSLVELSERLFEIGALPVYLHQLDKVKGSAHFEVSDHKALRLMEALRGRLPGFLLPRLVREVPGDCGKRPVGQLNTRLDSAT